MSFSPNPFAPDGRAPWLVIGFGGVVLRKVSLTKINGVSTKHEWKEQKSKETSGSVNTFSGTKYGHPKLTFEAASEEDFDELSALFDRMKPVPGQGGTGSTGTPSPTLGTPASFAIGSAAGKGGATAPAAPGGGADAPEKPASSSSTPNPGPRPPTISVQYPSLARHGILACALEEWVDVGFTATNSYEVEITIIPDKPPTPAGAGAMAPPAPGSQFSAGGGGGAGAPGGAGGDPVGKAAAAGAGGT